MKCPQCKAELGSDARFCSECGAKIAVAPAQSAVMPDFGNMRTEQGAQETITPSASEQRVMQPGEVFAQRFEIVSLIGVGGMGVVYRATDKVTSKDVALKLIRTDRLAGKSSTEAVQRLIREGVVSRDIRHENVVAVYDVGEANGQPYMSMEFLAGQSLRSWNQKRMNSNGDCSMKVAAAIIGEILAGLAAAHKAGVVHRDLKPDNVMLLGEPTENGVRLKILDFGVARAPGSTDTTSTALGTRGYMAPEQLTAPDSAQPSADLYSLSVMFYELLVGVLPLGHWQPPSNGRSDVPKAIDALIEKGLSNPRGRHQSVAEYLKALIDAMQDGGKPVPASDLPDWLKRIRDNKDMKWVIDVFGPTPPPVPTPPTDVVVGPPGPKPPTGMTLWKGFTYALTKRYADGKGRASLKEYWGFSLYGSIFGGLLLAIDYVNASTGEYPAGMCTIAAIILLGPPSIAITARRMHDLGQKASWGGAFFNRSLARQRGTVGPNAYGPDPLAPDSGGA